MTGRVVVETKQIFRPLPRTSVSLFWDWRVREVNLFFLSVVKLYGMYVLWIVLDPSGFLSPSAILVWLRALECSKSGGWTRCLSWPLG